VRQQREAKSVGKMVICSVSKIHPFLRHLISSDLATELGSNGCLIHLRRDHLPATQYRAARTQAFQAWAEVTGVAALA
jgi:hypothetical protein